MKTQFESETEAYEALRQARLKGLGWCPLIKQECRVDCICYYEGDIHHQEPKEFRKFTPSEKEYWFVHYPCCTNVLISGVIAADVRY